MEGSVYQGSMSLLVLVSVNQDVIHIYRDPSFSKFLGENGIHHSSKGGWRIGEAKKHYFWFE